ncbi:MAG: phosphohydrolase [Azospirillum sp.]|nr:phosphohydrolase [Azospirillum sp.]
MTQWIQTFSGIAFWPLDPKPEHVRIADIAHALSMKCRYNGHTRKFYSVAEHSVLVSRHVPEEDALWALLHDASEAYLPDVARPIKAAMPGFVEIEARVMRAVCEAYGLPEAEPISVKAADYAILHDEKAALMDPEAADWGLTGQGLDVPIMALEPAAANRVFLDRFFEIGGIR